MRFVFLVHRQIETREGKYEDRSEQDQGADNLSFREFHWAKEAELITPTQASFLIICNIRITINGAAKALFDQVTKV